MSKNETLLFSILILSYFWQHFYLLWKPELEASFWSSQHMEVLLEVLHTIAHIVQLFEIALKKLSVITESWNALGPWRSPSSSLPSRGRDIFHQTRLLKATSNLALSTPREGASTTSLGQLFQCLTALIGKNFFLISNLNLHSFSSKPLPLALSRHALVKSPSPAFSHVTFKYWKTSITSPCSLPFSRVNSPNSLSLSSQERCSIPLIIFVALLWTRSNKSTSFLCWWLQSWTQNSRWGLRWCVIMSLTASSAPCVRYCGPALDKLATGKDRNLVWDAKPRKNVIWLLL